MKFSLDSIQSMSTNVDTNTPAVLTSIRADATRIVGHDQPYYSLFYRIAQQFNPAFSVELGSWMATASSHLAIGNPAGKVITVDIHREDKAAQRYVYSLRGRVPNLQYINKWTWEAVSDIQAVGKPIDILYIDAWHEYQYAIKEWDLYKPLLADEALVIADDIMDYAGATVDMVKFWNDISNGYEKFLNVGLHSYIPMGFMRFVR